MQEEGGGGEGERGEYPRVVGLRLRIAFVVDDSEISFASYSDHLGVEILRAFALSKSLK